jgi:LysM repeat protein
MKKSTIAKSVVTAAGAFAVAGAAQVSANTVSVKAGDTLYKIASANGTTVDALVKANNISNANLIFVGQQLQTASSSSTTTQSSSSESSTTTTSSSNGSYTVKSGDTLNKIAAANGTTVANLVATNNISNANCDYCWSNIEVISFINFKLNNNAIINYDNSNNIK